MTVRPSQSTVSDMLNTLHNVAHEVSMCLLIGEKIECINEGGHLYNHLRSLTTPEYFTDEEYKWLCELGHEWNAEVKAYDNSQSKSRDTTDEQEFMNDIQDALDDLMSGFDGGDGS
tara:strand:- start:52 stop:399 length:348 start_codon:yes stop_codon:yes gene_type:complete